MNRTKIEYLTHSWNPLAMRCSPMSRGCQNCWHIKMADRFVSNPRIDREAQRAYSGVDVACLNVLEINAPLKLKTPGRIGVQFMGDLFHPDVSNALIHEVWNVAFNSPRHRFLFLTKRVIRLLRWTEEKAKVMAWPIEDIWPDWMWVGVSAEDQEGFDQRIKILFQVPAARKWVSIEPALGPVNVAQALTYRKDDLEPEDTGGKYLATLKGLDWVVMGGESGPRARPMNPDWAIAVKDQCRAAGVPFFFKSHGDNFSYHPLGKLRDKYMLEGREWREVP